MWQPIETAPKDGSKIITFWPGGGEWRAPSPGVQVGWWWEIGNAGMWAGWPHSYGDQPTHWMPLPEPPTRSEP